ncbi:gamma-glutamyltransferase [Luteimonas soli]|uniref:Glutathione hydrolase proenzyme n=1 Tax=Luteimonas soli TaxID=1648966 RepID=A0ABV7XMH1_9GAMM
MTLRILYRARTCVSVGVLVVLSACATGGHVPTPAPDEAVVVAAHPLAVDAGTAVLRRGGSAIDAAVAVQAMLGLVEPQSSGLGGGAFIMVYDADSGEVTSYVGRERAPALATPALLDDADGNPLPRSEAMLTGRATGVPGAVAVFAAAQRDHGRLRWDQLFDETIERAEEGFRVTPRLAQHIHGKFPQASAPDVTAYFSDAAGNALEVGDLLRNPAYADTLRTLAKGGPSAFYHGDIARAIVARTHQPPLGGAMSEQDLADYEPTTGEPICRPLRQYVLCVPPPPTSGVGLLQLMALLDGTDIDQRGPGDPQSWFLFAEASRIMYADRDQYVGDPRFVPVPVQGLLDPAYVDARRKLIGATAAVPAPSAGRPEGAPPAVADRTDEPGGTSHMVIVDAHGNAVSITTTIESFFGSGRMVDGFFLNNQLTDFSWNPAAGPVPAANAIAGGKRPRSSMTPAILLDRDGNFVGAIGSPGGSAIPAYIAKTLVGLVYWDLPLQQAVDLPNLVARGKRFNGEAARFSPRIRAGLERRGIEVRAGSGEDSGLHGVFIREGRLEWAADPRREGVGRSPE